MHSGIFYEPGRIYETFCGIPPVRPVRFLQRSGHDRTLLLYFSRHILCLQGNGKPGACCPELCHSALLPHQCHRSDAGRRRGNAVHAGALQGRHPARQRHLYQSCSDSALHRTAHFLTGTVCCTDSGDMARCKRQCSFYDNLLSAHSHAICASVSAEPNHTGICPQRRQSAHRHGCHAHRKLRQCHPRLCFHVSHEDGHIRRSHCHRLLPHF